MICHSCGKLLPGRRQVCPDTCRSRRALGKLTQRCACGRVKGPRAATCARCYHRHAWQDRKARRDAGIAVSSTISRPAQAIETAAEVDRKLAIIDAQKRRERWAA